MKRVAVLVSVLYCCFFSIGLSHAQEDASDQVQTSEEARDQAEEKQGTTVKGERAGEDELLNRIEELEKRINELTEESRARRKLEITEQEKQEKEKDILEAVGREYTMDPKHSLGLDYSVSYSFSPNETITNQYVVDRESNHTIRHSISASYSILDNLSVNATIPFVYRYDKIGTSDELDETDIGDISAGFSVQPIRSKAGEVSSTINFSVSLPTGRSPYDIVPGKELSTGNGVYSYSLGGSFSKQIDPVVAFWSLSYGYNANATGLDYKLSDTVILEKVEPGETFNIGGGLAYALSYKISVNSSISYSYRRTNLYYYEGNTNPVKSGDDASATLSLGMGWKVTQKTTLSLGVGYGLTGSGFSFTFRVPFTFVL